MTKSLIMFATPSKRHKGAAYMAFLCQPSLWLSGCFDGIKHGRTRVCNGIPPKHIRTWCMRSKNTSPGSLPLSRNASR